MQIFRDPSLNLRDATKISERSAGDQSMVKEIRISRHYRIEERAHALVRWVTDGGVPELPYWAVDADFSTRGVVCDWEYDFMTTVAA